MVHVFYLEIETDIPITASPGGLPRYVSTANYQCARIHINSNYLSIKFSIR